jgi:hypothetical protein
MTLPMMRLVVIALVALVVAVTLAVLLVPSHSWAAALEWFMNPPQYSPCGCVVDPGSNS